MPVRSAPALALHRHKHHFNGKSTADVVEVCLVLWAQLVSLPCPPEFDREVAFGRLCVITGHLQFKWYAAQSLDVSHKLFDRVTGRLRNACGQRLRSTVGVTGSRRLRSTAVVNDVDQRCAGGAVAYHRLAEVTSEPQ